VSTDYLHHFTSGDHSHLSLADSVIELNLPSEIMSVNDEKPEGRERIEDIEAINRLVSRNDVDDDEEYTPQEQRKIIHRVDHRLVTMTGLAYCVSLMDRTNLSAAAIAG
jgi:hypothetical protein